MVKSTAIEQAKKMFDKLVNLKINNPQVVTKTNQKVGVLPNGQILMSNGQSQVAPIQKKFSRLQGDILERTENPRKVQDFAKDMSLRIAIPGEQLGTGEDTAFAFVDYLNRLLQPRPNTSPDLGLPSLLPGPSQVLSKEPPSAIANLPAPVPQSQTILEENESFNKKFMVNTAGLRKRLAEEFLAQYNRGEQSVQDKQGRLGGNTPLVARYNASQFRLPTEQNAAFARIASQLANYNTIK